MATFRKIGNRWKAEVAKQGIRESKSFGTKSEAQSWARDKESEIEAGNTGAVPNKTFGDLLGRYGMEVSVNKKGERWELLRIGMTQRDPIAAVRLRDLDSRAIAEWRDRRLAQVSALSVRREWALLSHACSIAVKEWKWLSVNPMQDVRKPAGEQARDRIATQDELDRITETLGYSRNETPTAISARIGASVLFAVETAMRAGEIAALSWDRVFIDRRFCSVTGGKTIAAKRDVPLSSEAIRIIQQMPKDSDLVFNLKTSQMDALFRKARGNSLVDGLRYHDLRATGITRLAQRLNILELARSVGHKDLKMLQVYFRDSAEDISKKLD